MFTHFLSKLIVEDGYVLSNSQASDYTQNLYLFFNLHEEERIIDKFNYLNNNANKENTTISQ
jgi:hypothetical protein